MSSPSPPPRFQFSLRWMLIGVAVIALLLGLGGIPLTGIMVRGLLPTVALVAAVYGRGDVRAFSIGASVSCIPILTADVVWLGASALVLGAISQLVVMGICGAAAVATRRSLANRGLTDRD